MNGRRVALMTLAGVRDSAALRSSILHSYASEIGADWRAISTGCGAALIGGSDTHIGEEWIVAGAASADPRGLPGRPMLLKDLAAELSRYGADTATMVAGPWIGIHKADHNTVRPINQIVPWFDAVVGGNSMFCSDTALWPRETIWRAAVTAPALVGPDAVPGFSLRRLDAEVRGWVAAARTDRVPHEIWSPALSELQGELSEASAQLRTWIETAQSRWLAANRDGRVLWVPALERVVIDQLNYGIEVAA